MAAENLGFLLQQWMFIDVTVVASCTRLENKLSNRCSNFVGRVFRYPPC